MNDAGLNPNPAIVMGLGRFGGGLGAARFLTTKYGRVIVTDPADEVSLADPIKQLTPFIESGRISLKLGPQDPSLLKTQDFRDASLLVVNPAVPRPWDHPFIIAAKEQGIAVTTEIELLFDHLPETLTVIGVTGTAGKSTTASMIHAGLIRADVRSHLGGNLGGSLLNTLDSIQSGDTLVLELSSAMLWWLSQRSSSTQAFDVGVLTSFAPNHIDWHGSLDHYRSSKQILAESTTGTLVDLTRLNWPTAAKRVEPAGPLPGDLRVLGEHNTRNAACALAACEALGFKNAWQGIAEFPGLPHRLCIVHGTTEGTRFINDSKSTTPESTALAIKALDGPPATIRLIAGGYDKRVDLSPMTEAAKGLAHVYAIGTTAPVIAQQLPNSTNAKTLEQAMLAIARDASPGDTILLSPGCASWDQFDNFEQRGDLFTSLARQHFGDK